MMSLRIALRYILTPSRHVVQVKPETLLFLSLSRLQMLGETKEIEM